MKNLFLISLFLFLAGCGDELGNPEDFENKYKMSFFGLAPEEAEFCDDVLNNKYLSNLSLPTFADVKTEWNNITTNYSGIIDNSMEPMTVLELEAFLIEHNYEKDPSIFISDVNLRGNSLMSFTSSIADYCAFVMYIEK